MKQTAYLLSIILSFFSFMSFAADKKAEANPEPLIVGKVLEILNGSGYVYLKLEGKDKKEIWAAGTAVEIKVGDYARIDTNNLMQNFESKTLKRKFEKVYFSTNIEVGKTPDSFAAAKPVATAPTNPHGAATTPNPAALKKIEKIKDGKTVAEIFAQKKDLKNKTIKVRAQVVKFSAQILGKNWLHIQDGSGKEGSNNLVVTTDDKAEIGDIVEVEGKIVLDKDFGAGYKYDVIIEDAKVKK